VWDNTWIIVPFYNESAVIRTTIEALRAHFAHVVCVDDGSTDQGGSQLSGTGVVTVRHPLNLGQGAALQTGIEYALLDSKAEYFVTFDADGQHSVDDALAMLELLDHTGADVVFGSRFLRPDGGPKGLRRLLLRLGTVYTNLTAGVRLTDTHNGLRAFNRVFAQSLDLQSGDMAHATEIIIHAGTGGFAILEAPTTILYTKYSLSKGQPLINGVNIAVDALLDLFRKGPSR